MLFKYVLILLLALGPAWSALPGWACAAVGTKAVAAEMSCCAEVVAACCLHDCCCVEQDATPESSIPLPAVPPVNPVRVTDLLSPAVVIDVLAVQLADYPVGTYASASIDTVHRSGERHQAATCSWLI